MSLRTADPEKNEADMQVLYSVINFILLVAIIWIFGKKAIMGIFSSRREKIENGLADAESAGRIEEEKRAAIEEAARNLSASETETAKRLEQAASKYAKTLNEQADKEISVINADLEESLKSMKFDMLHEARANVVHKVADECRELFSKEPYLSQFRKDEPAIADRILKIVSLTPGDKVYISSKGLLYVTLTSAFELEPAVTEKIRSHMEKLVAAEGSTISFWVKTDEKCIGGLKLRVGDTVYDGTIDNILWTLLTRLKRSNMNKPDMSADEIKKGIISGLKGLSREIDIYQLGRVLSVSDGICWLDGLTDSMYGELVELDNGERGMLLSIEPSRIACVVFGKYENIRELSSVRRLGMMADVPVGDELLGRIVDPLGKPIDGKGGIHAKSYMPIENPAPAILDRQAVNSPLQTGIKAIDALVPIGKGQRELIIGDRQTGKTAIAVDTILNQRGKNVICIYVAIGQKETGIASIASMLKKNGALDYTIIVCADAYQSAPMRYIAPYAGTTMGEYFMNRGKDVLIIYDDLSKHAVSYREISLLLHRPSGREAFPGDVFYLHSRLLERSAHLSEEKGGGSLTALPIVETQAGDISAYIPTNVISITDGQIFLESELFHEGQRPAVNVGLSVSRVGGSAQIPAMKQMAGGLRISLAQYRELASFAQFGADLDQATQASLDRGERMTIALRQDQYEPLDAELQVLIIYAFSEGFADDVAPEKIPEFEDALIKHFKSAHPDLIAVLTKGKITPKTKERLNEALKLFKGSSE